MTRTQLRMLTRRLDKIIEMQEDAQIEREEDGTFDDTALPLSTDQLMTAIGAPRPKPQQSSPPVTIYLTVDMATVLRTFNITPLVVPAPANATATAVAQAPDMTTTPADGAMVRTPAQQTQEILADPSLDQSAPTIRQREPVPA